MSGILFTLTLILIVLVVIAFSVFRMVDGLKALVQGQEEITEALWAKMGCTREEWRRDENAARLAEFEQRHREESEMKKS
jgi:predicted Holliday junction resolvase-like endonuclease